MVKYGDDLLATLLALQGNEETRARRSKEEQERSMLILNTLREAKKTLLGKGKIDHDASSSSFSKKPRVVSEEPTRRQPVLEIQPNRHDGSSSSMSKRRRVVSQEPSRAQPMVSDESIRAQPIRKIKPVRGRNRPVRRKPVKRERGVTPGWVLELMREKNGADVKLVIEKTITASDLDTYQARLNMPVKQVVEKDFLNEAEVNILEEFRQKISEKGVDVMLVDANGGKWSLNLRIWEMTSTINYVLCSGWKEVIPHLKPKEGHTISLWSFHSQGGKLYFAMHLKLPTGDTDQPLAQDSSQAFVPAIASASSSSSSMALVVARDSDDPFICVETNRRLINFPRTRMRVCVPSQSRDSGNLGASVHGDGSSRGSTRDRDEDDGAH